MTAPGDGAWPETVDLALGERRCYRLPGRIGGGYRWSAEVVEGASVTATIEIDPAAAAANLGSGSPEVVVVEAVATGAAVVAVTQRRSWETGRAPLEGRRMAVRVSTVAPRA
jgi:predicted secreted protein